MNWEITRNNDDHSLVLGAGEAILLDDLLAQIAMVQEIYQANLRLSAEMLGVADKFESLGRGVPDLLVGHNGYWYLMEVKDGGKSPSRRQLTDDQIRWAARVAGRAQIDVVKSVEEALDVIHVSS